MKTYSRVGRETCRHLLLLPQIPDFDLSAQVSKSSEQHETAEVVEVNAISDAGSKIEDRVALKIE